MDFRYRNFRMNADVSRIYGLKGIQNNLSEKISMRILAAYNFQPDVQRLVLPVAKDIRYIERIH